MARALVFDLDDTLVVEEPAAVAAFAAAAAWASSRCDVDAAALAVAARARARELWRAFPSHPFCARIGISSWEGLWCRFEGDAADLCRLREWAPAYRTQAWALALAERGVEDGELAAELGERFASERRARHEAFADALPVLTELRESHALALVTNGASCLQREKLSASGLADLFDHVVVSGDIMAGKPDAAIFHRALSKLGCAPADATMIGESLARDVDGALAAGLGAVWINRARRPRPDGRDDVREIRSLSELRVVL